MKQASAEIRALNKQLGINDEPEKKAVEVKVTTFDSIKERRQNRAAKAKNTGLARMKLYRRRGHG